MLGDLLYGISKLLKQVAEGDQKAFRVVFDHYKAPFHAAAFKMTRSVNISQEIVQEVFVTIWVKRDLVGAAKSPEAYVFTILHNCIYSHFRKLAQYHKLKSKLWKEEEKSEDIIEALLLEKENKAILENVISQLPPQQRLIYKLAKQEGLSRGEIALRLNISPNTVKNHLAAGVEFIRGYYLRIASATVWSAIYLHL